MPIRNGEYVKRTGDEQFETVATELVAQNGDANPRAESTYTYALIFALTQTLAQNQEQSLKNVYNAAYIVDATGKQLTKKARNLGVVRRSAQKATGVVTFSRDSAAPSDFVIPSGTIVETLSDDPVQFETTDPVTLANGTTSIDATVRAVEGGSDGNVGPNAIQAMPSPPTGVDEVTNSQTTGDPTLTDTNGDPLREGKDRENDAELRKRVLDTDAVSEGPSTNGIDKALDDVEGIVTHDVNTNQTNSIVNGIDPYSTEVIALGGDTFDIARTLKETMSVTTLLRLQGGVNGSKETTTVRSDLLDQDITVPITRPNLLDFDVEIDVVHTTTYAGDIDVKDAMVNYVGGTRADDSTTTGLGIGENVLVNELENVSEDVVGVEYADVTLVDTDDDGNDDTSTDSDGVPILSVGGDEVPRLDADNVTVSTTAR